MQSADVYFVTMRSVRMDAKMHANYVRKLL